MKTQTFLSDLQRQGGKALIFAYGDEQIGPGYHVTEIKTATIQTMDCGGQKNTWAETILQVWHPKQSEDKQLIASQYISVEKFLDIYQRVASSIPLISTAELRVEYGPWGEPAISYLVTELELRDDAVVVRLEPPAVACKGASELFDIPVLSTNSACCQPTASACCA